MLVIQIVRDPREIPPDVLVQRFVAEASLEEVQAQARKLVDETPDAGGWRVIHGTKERRLAVGQR